MNQTTRGLVYQTDPLKTHSDDQMDEVFEMLRGAGEPLLVFRMESKDKYDLWRKLDELNDELRTLPTDVRIPYPEGWGYDGA